jgi:hypothetical protein
LYGTVVAPDEDADFDADGDVDGADFLTWQRGVGVGGVTHSMGDANGDAVVDPTPAGCERQVIHDCAGTWFPGATGLRFCRGGDSALATNGGSRRLVVGE